MAVGLRSNRTARVPGSCLIFSGLSLLARLVSVTLGLLLLGLVTSEGVAVATLLLIVTSVGLSLTVAGITASRSTLRDSDGRRAAAEVTLGSDNLVVVGAELHAGLRPGIEVGADIDATLGAVLLADGPVLLEGLGAVDRGGVGASGLEDLVGAAVNIDGSLALSAAGGVVGAECLDDVVLDERALGPAVDGEVAVTVGGVLSGKADGSAWLVSKTPDQV